MLDDPATFREVIADIHDATVDPTKSSAALGCVRHYVGGHEVMMYRCAAGGHHVDRALRAGDDRHGSKLSIERGTPLNPVFPAASLRGLAPRSFHVVSREASGA